MAEWSWGLQEGKRGQVEKQQQMGTFWPAPATSADATAVGDWGLTVTKGKGSFNGTAFWVLQGHQGRCTLFREGWAGVLCMSHGGAFPGEVMGGSDAVRMRKGWWGTEKVPSLQQRDELD